MQSQHRQLELLFPTFLLLFMLISLSCSDQPNEPDFEKQLVINGFLRLGSGVDSIYVSQTVPIGDKFDLSASRVRNAVVQVRRQGDRWFRLSEYPPQPVSDNNGNTIAEVGGVYYLPADSLRVEAEVTYELSVEALGLHAVAQTKIPSQLELVEINRGEDFGDRPLFMSGDTVEYVSGKSFADPPLMTMFWKAVPGVSIYRLIADADDGGLANMIRDTTTAAEIFKGELEDREEPFAFNIAFDPNLQPMRGRVIWLYFNYYGWHTMRLVATDAAYARYMQGQFAEEQIREMPRSNVVGGLGIFASYAEVNFRVFIKKGPRSEP